MNLNTLPAVWVILIAMNFSILSKENHLDSITPVYQWADDRSTPYFFIENPVYSTVAKPKMFLQVGNSGEGPGRYWPADSLHLFLDPAGKAMEEYCQSGKTKTILGRILFLSSLTLAIIGNWQDNSIPLYIGSGVSFCGGLICISIPAITQSGRLRIINIHNRSLGYKENHNIQKIKFGSASNAPIPKANEIIPGTGDSGIIPLSSMPSLKEDELIKRVKRGQNDYVFFKGKIVVAASIQEFNLPDGFSLEKTAVLPFYSGIMPSENNEIAEIYMSNHSVYSQNVDHIYFCNGTRWQTLKPAETAAPKDSNAMVVPKKRNALENQERNERSENIARYQNLAKSMYSTSMSDRCADVLFTLANLDAEEYAASQSIENFIEAAVSFQKVYRYCSNARLRSPARIKLDSLLNLGNIKDGGFLQEGCN